MSYICNCHWDSVACVCDGEHIHIKTPLSASYFDLGPVSLFMTFATFDVCEAPPTVNNGAFGGCITFRYKRLTDVFQELWTETWWSSCSSLSLLLVVRMLLFWHLFWFTRLNFKNPWITSQSLRPLSLRVRPAHFPPCGDQSGRRRGC